MNTEKIPKNDINSFKNISKQKRIPKNKKVGKLKKDISPGWYFLPARILSISN